MKTSKKILGATLALSLIIPLSGCGGSKYAVKGCKPTENFPCVPAEDNNTKDSLIVTDSLNNIELGSDLTTGSKITITPKKIEENDAYIVQGFAIKDPEKLGKYKKIDVTIDGETISGTGQYGEIKLNKDRETVIELPEEAIGKYVSFQILIDYQATSNVGEVEVTVE